jgi:hydroxypyruvate isomerase
LLSPFLAKVLREVGYQRAIGMEAYPLENADLALERFRAAFTQK